MVEKRRRSDWLLLLLYAPGISGKPNEAIEGKLKVMKQLFILGKELKMPNYYEFIPHDNGPISFEAYAHLRELKKDGLIVELMHPDNKYVTYKLSSRGENIVKGMFGELPKAAKAKLVEIKKKFNPLSFYSLMSYIYDNYPMYAAFSSYSLIHMYKQ